MNEADCLSLVRLCRTGGYSVVHGERGGAGGHSGEKRDRARPGTGIGLGVL